MTERRMKLRERSARNYGDTGEDEDEIEGRRTFDVLSKLNPSIYNGSFVKYLKAKDVTLEYMQLCGFKEPIMVLEKTGLGLKVPSSNFTVSDVKKCVGNRRMVDVMDCVTQKGIDMTMKEWTEYYENPQRDRLLNVISLEISHTPLEHYVDSPTVVRQIDWVDCAWPLHLKTAQKKATNTIEDMMYPKVQKYCLMSVGGCFTDFHIDFGGSSVWYHVLRGKKIFWLIPPTEENIRHYEHWTLSGKQGEIFLGDKVEKCQMLEINEGNTFLMPSGWIHAVYTPCDSLVFGGNFIHSFNISMQLRIYGCEEKTKVPVKFKYPFFEEMQWYVLERYVHRLTGVSFLRRLDGDDDPNEEPPSLPDPLGHQQSSPTAVSNTTPKRRGRPPKNRPADMQTALQCNGVAEGQLALTPYERQGLLDIVAWVQNDPRGRLSVPHMVKWPQALIRAAKKLLCLDSSKDIASSRFILQWSDEHIQKYAPPPRQYTDVQPFSTKSPKIPVTHPHGSAAPSSSVTSMRRRRVRCKKCESCNRGNCRECAHCKDMRKYGGTGRRKKTCLARICLSPMLPHDTTCCICKHESVEDAEQSGSVATMDDLRECQSCLDIVHPQCYRSIHPGCGEGIDRRDLTNSWTCPKCAATETEGSARPLPASVMASFVSSGTSMTVNGESVTPSSSVLTTEPRSEVSVFKAVLPDLHVSMETDQQLTHGSISEARSSGHHYHTSAAARSTGQTAMERAQQRKAAHNLMFGTVNRVRSKYHRFQKIINVAGKTGAKRKADPDQQHHSPAKKRAINASLTLTPSPLLLSPQVTLKAEQHPLQKRESPLARHDKIVLKGKKLMVKAEKTVKSEKAAQRSAAASSAAISTLQQCHRQDIERKIMLQQHHRSRGRLALRLLGKENEASGSGPRASNAPWPERNGRGNSGVVSAGSRRIAGSASKKSGRKAHGSKTGGRAKSPHSSIRMRKGRCGQCEGCRNGNCGTCFFCVDMIKFGGPGRLKQACLKRRCILQPADPRFFDRCLEQPDDEDEEHTGDAEESDIVPDDTAEGSQPASDSADSGESGVELQQHCGRSDVAADSAAAACRDDVPSSGISHRNFDRKPSPSSMASAPLETSSMASAPLETSQPPTRDDGEVAPTHNASILEGPQRKPVTAVVSKTKSTLHGTNGSAADSSKMAALQKITKSHKKFNVATTASPGAAPGSHFLSRRGSIDARANSASGRSPSAGVDDDQLPTGHRPRQQQHLAQEPVVAAHVNGSARTSSSAVAVVAATPVDHTQDEAIWTNVFAQLRPRDLVHCMEVCKHWRAWAQRPRFWRSVDLSRRTVSWGALAFAVARQPWTLQLGFSDVQPRQLQAALGLMSSLCALHLNNTTRELVLGALGGPAPLPQSLNMLELSWVPRLDDDALRELLRVRGAGGSGASSAASGGATTRMFRVTSLSLRGTDVGDTTLRLLTRCMPRLAVLDVSRCDRVTDAGVNFLTCAGSSVQRTLSELHLTSCSGLTAACLPMLSRCPQLRTIDLTACGGVTDDALAAFAAPSGDPRHRRWTLKGKRLEASSG